MGEDVCTYIVTTRHSLEVVSALHRSSNASIDINVPSDGDICHRVGITAGVLQVQRNLAILTTFSAGNALSHRRGVVAEK